MIHKDLDQMFVPDQLATLSFFPFPSPQLAKFYLTNLRNICGENHDSIDPHIDDGGACHARSKKKTNFLSHPFSQIDSHDL